MADQYASNEQATSDPALLERGRLFFAKPWKFETSSPSLEALPPMGGVEVAFAGRSNVGKSSIINAVTGVNGLARTSNTPGRTQMLNYFSSREGLSIVDMPGYGYAKAPVAIVEEWNALIMDYLRGRANLRRVYVLIDSRHGLKKNDLEVMEMLDKAAVSYQIVLTKIDKIKPPAVKRVTGEVEAAISRRPAAFPQVIVTSSEKNIGIDVLRAAIVSFV